MEVLAQFIRSNEIAVYAAQASSMVFMAFCLHRILVYCNFSWAKQRGYFLVVLLLPTVTAGITQIISTNIALSLGLVGALSIVRFRHPVRTSVELVVYFLLIGIGIVGSQSLLFAFLLFCTSAAIIIFSKSYRGVGDSLVFEEDFSAFASGGTVATVVTHQFDEVLREFQGLASFKYEDNEWHFLYRLDVAALDELEAYLRNSNVVYDRLEVKFQ